MGWFWLGLLVVCVTVTLTDAECHCSTTQLCNKFPSTPCSQMDGQDMCQEGWFGRYCQKQNIALGRSCSQSSTLYNIATQYGAALGVDGRATTTALSEPRTCAHTNNETNPTWTVSLNTSVPEKIQHIRLYIRDRLQERSNGMEILVGSRMCYNWSSTEHPPPIANVTCRQPLRGTTVTIRIPGPLKFLTLCEVQIFVCSDGWFSEDCDKQCRCLSRTDVCDKITGHCSSGCRPGYNGTDCQTECPNGYYGPNCRLQCGNCVDGDVCIKTNGTCPGGCAAGWINDMCIQPCPSGYYGLTCGFQCGSCVDGDVCIKTNGTCPGGCAAGWLNDRCNQPCPNGYYGLACGVQCGSCVDGDVCIKTNGTCPGGCAAGWFSDRCNQPCPEGRYGANCASPCGHCQGTDVCDKVTGKCPGGCQPGWWPDFCSQGCSDGRHGHHCQSECGQCKADLPCNKINGTCDQGCRPGFQEPLCKECVDGLYGVGCMSRCGQCQDAQTCDKSSGECPEGCQGNFMKPLCQGCTECPATSGHSNQVVPVAATLGTLLVLALIALLTSIIYIRRMKIQLEGLQKKPEDNYLSLDERTKGPVEHDTYERINNATAYANGGHDPQGRS